MKRIAPNRPPDFVWSYSDNQPEGDKSKFWFNEMVSQGWDPLSKSFVIEDIEHCSDGRIGKRFTLSYIIEKYPDERDRNDACSFFSPIQEAYRAWRNDVAAKELLDYDKN